MGTETVGRLDKMKQNRAAPGAEVILPRAHEVRTKGDELVVLHRVDYQKGMYADEKQDVSEERVLVGRQRRGEKLKEELWIGGYPTALLSERQVRSLKRWQVPDASRDTSKPHVSASVVTRLPGPAANEAAARPGKATKKEKNDESE